MRKKRQIRRIIHGTLTGLLMSMCLLPQTAVAAANPTAAVQPGEEWPEYGVTNGKKGNTEFSVEEGQLNEEPDWGIHVVVQTVDKKTGEPVSGMYVTLASVLTDGSYGPLIDGEDDNILTDQNGKVVFHIQEKTADYMAFVLQDKGYQGGAFGAHEFSEDGDIFIVELNKDSGNNSGEDPKDNPGDDPKDNPGDDPKDNPGDDPKDNPGEDPKDNPGDNPGDNPKDNPGDNPKDNPGDNPKDNPGDDSKGTPGDNPKDTPGDGSKGGPGNGGTDTPGNNDTDSTGDPNGSRGDTSGDGNGNGSGEDNGDTIPSIGEGTGIMESIGAVLWTLLWFLMMLLLLIYTILRILRIRKYLKAMEDWEREAEK